MAVTCVLSNHYKAQKDKGLVDHSSATHKLILMNTTFSFDKDAHATLADVTADQLATGNGYTQNDKVLTNPVVTEDDVNDKSKVTFDDATFTASGGDIGPMGSAIIYLDDTDDDTVVGCIDFGTDYTISNGLSFQFQNIQIDSN